MGTSNRTTFLGEMRVNGLYYLMAVPAIAYTLIFGYLTLPYMLIAFQRYTFQRGILGSEFVGFENFRFFFAGNDWLRITRNTLRLNLLFVLSTHFGAITISLLINEIRWKAFKRVTQSVLLLPEFISWIVVSYFVYQLLSTNSGVVNHFLGRFGVERVNWYTTPGAWNGILVIVRVWKGLGIGTVIYLAAIAGINREIYESAIIDGASCLRQAWSITVPLLLPTVFVLMLLSVGRIFYGDFAMIYALVRDNGILYSTTDVIDTYLFRALRKVGDPSWAMAIGFLQSILGFVFVFGSNYLVRKVFPQGALF